MRGHVRKRGSKWAAVLFLGIDESGKRKYKWFSGFDTKKAAEKALTEKLQAVDTGAYVVDSKVTFGSYMESWLQDKSTQVRAGTYRSYEWLVTKHIIPFLGGIPLTEVKPGHLQRFYRELQQTDQPLSNRSILHAHRLINQALDRAVKWGLLSRNVAQAVEPPRPNNPLLVIWTEEELRCFLSAVQGSRYYVVFLLAASTGMRLGEILAVRWKDIDFQNAVLHVRRSYSYTGKGYKFEEPKTESGKRAISLSSSIVGYLMKHKQVQIKERLLAGGAWNDNDLAVCTALGCPVTQSNVRMLFYRVIKNTELPRIRIHDLRHLHATILLKQGVHPKIVQERLGHADIQTTLNTYSHVLPGLQEAAAQGFDSVLKMSIK